MRFLVLPTIIVASVLAVARAETTDPPATAFATTGATIVFKVGQRWTVKDSGMTLAIRRIEPFGQGKTAISISLFMIPCPPKAGCTTMTVEHLPFDAAALQTSVGTLIEENAEGLPDFEAPYAYWKQDKGGVFDIPVSRIPEILFKTIGDRKIQGD